MYLTGVRCRTVGAYALELVRWWCLYVPVDPSLIRLACKHAFDLRITRRPWHAGSLHVLNEHVIGTVRIAVLRARCGISVAFSLR